MIPPNMQGKVIEYLRFLDLPPAEKLKLAHEQLGKKKPPPWLDDDVCNLAFWNGLIRRAPMLPNEKNEPGTSIASDGDGRVSRVELSDLGRRALKENGPS